MAQPSNYCETVRKGISLEEVEKALETIKEQIRTRGGVDGELRLVTLRVEISDDSTATVTLGRNLTHAEWSHLVAESTERMTTSS